MSQTKIVGRDPATGSGLEITIGGGRVLLVENTDATDDVYISAGLVDLQVNGHSGLDFNGDDLSVEVVSRLVRLLIQTGVTTFAPTLITAAEVDLLHRLRCIHEACLADPLVAACTPIIHVEGPYISPKDGFRGAHPLGHVRPPSIDEFERWQKACGGRIGIVTLSPHFTEAEGYIKHLAARGVLVSLGHTHATHLQIERAVTAGARLSTHLGNGIATEIDRHENPIWSQLADNRLTASFIADGHHLPEAPLKAMLRAKGLDRCILISDSVALAGMPAGSYETTIGGHVNLSSDGRLSLAGTSLLAGSAVCLLRCVERAVQLTGLPLAAVLRMATEVPGSFVGRGGIKVGERADILRFRWSDEHKTAAVHDVWVGGERQFLAH